MSRNDTATRPKALCQRPLILNIWQLLAFILSHHCGLAPLLKYIPKPKTPQCPLPNRHQPPRLSRQMGYEPHQKRQTQRRRSTTIGPSQVAESWFYYRKNISARGNLLLRLDYADQGIATESTQKWINDVAKRAGAKTWGHNVVGSLAKVDATVGTNPKKRAAEGDVAVAAVEANCINTLSTGLVRKKAKVANHLGPVPTQEAESNRK